MNSADITKDCLAFLEQSPVEWFAPAAVGICDSWQVTNWRDFLANLDGHQTEFKLVACIQSLLLKITRVILKKYKFVE